MRLKSYFAGTVEAAMALAREELGPDAMLVQSKRATADARHAGDYEVVFAHPRPEPSADAPLAPAAEAVPFHQLLAAQRDSAIQALSAELAALRQRVEGISGNLTKPVPTVPFPEPVPEPHPPRIAELTRRLQDLDIEAGLAGEIAREAGSAASPDRLRALLRVRVKVDASLGVPAAERKVVALVGAPGAGKTTVLVKLATAYGLSARRSMHLISTDVFRVGAAEQLRLYASILGVGFQTVETPLSLAQALEEQGRKELVFIDTPGWVRRDLPEIRDLAEYMANDPTIDVHVVLPASNRACDIARMVNRYEIYRPGKLLFTRLDETDRFGPLINLSHHTGKPISFLSGGEQIPEDIEPATVERVTELLLGRHFEDEPVGVSMEEAR